VADEVRRRDDGDDQPVVVGVEAVVVTVARLGDQSGDQRADGDREVDVQLVGLGQVLGLGAQPRRGAARQHPADRNGP
jgi:hypothetical protein